MTEQDILAHYYAEESRQVRDAERDAVNAAITATAEALGIPRERVRDAVLRDMGAGFVG